MLIIKHWKYKYHRESDDVESLCKRHPVYTSYGRYVLLMIILPMKYILHWYYGCVRSLWTVILLICGSETPINNVQKNAVTVTPSLLLVTSVLQHCRLQKIRRVLYPDP